MPHAVIAIEQRRARAFADHANLGSGIHPAVLNPFHVERQPKHAMRIRPVRVRVGHERAHLLRIASGHSHRH
jgi:hypothetical protein